MVTTAYRWLDKLTDNFRTKVEGFIAEVWDEIFITESYRSQERQNYLYSLGRTVAGSKVTWTLNSNHTKGLAIDIAFKGSYLYPADFNKWKAIWEIAKKHGIDWGYDLWGVDKPHFQDNWVPIIEKMGTYREILERVYPDSHIYNDRDKAFTLSGDELTAFLLIGIENNWIEELDVSDIIEYNQGSSVDCTIYAGLTAAANVLGYRFDSDKVMIKAKKYQNIKGWTHPTRQRLGGVVGLLDYIFGTHITVEAFQHSQVKNIEDGTWILLAKDYEDRDDHVLCVTKIDWNFVQVDNYAGVDLNNISVIEDIETYMQTVDKSLVLVVK